MKDVGTGQRGAITYLMLITTVLVVTAGFGTWGFLRHWRFLAETQLRIDQCTRTAALELKATQQLVERTNQDIRAVRALLVAGSLEPPLAAAMRVALRGLSLRQDAALLTWRGRQATWLLPTHCGDWRDNKQPLPTLLWARPPADLIGPRPLRWDAMPNHFEIRVSRPPRHSIAWIGVNTEDQDEFTISNAMARNWRARWIAHSALSK